MHLRALDRLRRTGLSVELVEGNLEVSPVEKVTTDHRRTVAQHREEIVKVLRKELLDRLREAAEPSDPFAPISDSHPATKRQLERIRELRRREEVPVHAAEDAETRVRAGLSEREALELIYSLGGRIQERERVKARAGAAEGGTCEECGRGIGPSSSVCGRCKGIRQGLAVRGDATGEPAEGGGRERHAAATGEKSEDRR